MREDNRLHFNHRPGTVASISQSEPHQSLWEYGPMVLWAVGFVIVLVAVIRFIMWDGIWTDPDNGCRYRVGYGESTSYTPLLLPSGLPDRRGEAMSRSPSSNRSAAEKDATRENRIKTFVVLLWFVGIAGFFVLTGMSEIGDTFWRVYRTGCFWREPLWGTRTPVLLPSGLPDCKPWVKP